MANNNAKSCVPGVEIKRIVSVLASDYSGLENLPEINGVSLVGNKGAKELSLLSSKTEDYQTVSLVEAGKSNGYVVVLGDSGETSKVSLMDFTSQVTGFTTNDEINKDVAIGAYQFVKVEN